jgi:predicted DNA-binding protein
MEVHFTPDVERKLNAIAKQMGRPAPELVQDAVAGYVSEIAPVDAYQRAQTAAARIREIQTRVKPDPEGWTIKDYINYGRP